MKKLLKLGLKSYSNFVKSSLNKPKILVLVLCSRNYLSYVSSRAPKRYGIMPNTIEVVHYIGRVDKSVREKDYLSNFSKDYLIINTDDSYSNIAKKTLLAFENVLNNYSFDYLFRSNTSSYLNFKKLISFTEENLKDLQYCGVTLTAQEGDKIASGAGIFLSRKNIELLVESKYNIDFSLPDDVAIARVLKKSITPSESIRYDLKDVPKPKSVHFSSQFHYRCRLDPDYPRLLEPLLLSFYQEQIKLIYLLI